MILTVSRISAEKQANPGYRAFFANGFNVTRLLVLVLLGGRPRADRGAAGSAAATCARAATAAASTRSCAAAMCVVVRDLIVYGVLSDMMQGRPAVYATFSSYDEVAHHSGLERADTLEALRKLDQQFGRIDRARRYAPRPYEIVVLSDHGQTQGATFKQRNGYGLDDLVGRSLERPTVAARRAAATRTTRWSATPSARRPARRRPREKRVEEATSAASDVVVLGSGNLGLVYLMEEPRRLTLEEIDERHPELLPALREHPHVGFVLVRSASTGRSCSAPRGTHYLADGRVDGEDPLAPFSPTRRAAPRAAPTASRTSPTCMVGSFYDPELDEGCAFEELISFHGGLGGPQTRPFVLIPVGLPLPDEPIVGAGPCTCCSGWRRLLQNGAAAPPPEPTPAADVPVGG